MLITNNPSLTKVDVIAKVDKWQSRGGDQVSDASGDASSEQSFADKVGVSRATVP
jgi:hypothetical protein